MNKLIYKMVAATFLWLATLSCFKTTLPQVPIDVSGIAMDTLGKPLPNFTVILVKSHYVSLFANQGTKIDSAITDSVGRFAMRPVVGSADCSTLGIIAQKVEYNVFSKNEAGVSPYDCSSSGPGRFVFNIKFFKY